jgi:hypothetical protein
MEDTKLIISNLETLLEAVKAFPESNLDLGQYKHYREDCGTLFCTAGLAASMHEFNAQGVTFSGDFVRVNGEWPDETSDTNDIFGHGAWKVLFAPHGCGSADKELGAVEVMYKSSTKAMSDKALAIARLEYQLDIYKEKNNGN